MSYFSTATNDQLYAFRQIVVTKILFYPGRGKHRNSRQQKWSKTQSLSRAQLPSKPCYSIENWETIHPRVPSIFRCQNKAWDVYARKLLQLRPSERSTSRWSSRSLCLSSHFSPTEFPMRSRTTTVRCINFPNCVSLLIQAACIRAHLRPQPTPRRALITRFRNSPPRKRRRSALTGWNGISECYVAVRPQPPCPYRESNNLKSRNISTLRICVSRLSLRFWLMLQEHVLFYASKRWNLVLRRVGNLESLNGNK